eukprot:10932266-Alexandrium_andersonii.AAC.1
MLLFCLPPLPSDAIRSIACSGAPPWRARPRLKFAAVRCARTGHDREAACCQLARRPQPARSRCPAHHQQHRPAAVGRHLVYRLA